MTILKSFFLPLLYALLLPVAATGQGLTQYEVTYALSADSLKFIHFLDVNPKLIYKTDSTGRTLLSYAFSRHKLKHADVLLQRGADLYKKDNSCHLPCSFPDVPDLELLEKYGFDFNYNDTETICEGVMNVKGKDIHYEVHFVPLLITAVRGFDYLCVPFLLEHGANPNIKDRSGFRPLTLALSNGSDEVVRWLLDAGADANIKDDYTGSYPIHHVSAQCNGCIELLLKAGANINSLDGDSATALYRSISLFKLFADTSSDLAKDLIAHGAAVEALDSIHYPLREAAYWDRADIIEILFKSGDRINEVGKDTTTALHIAVRRGNVNAVDMLLKHGASTFIKDRKGRTALDIMPRQEAMKVKYLLTVARKKEEKFLQSK